METAWVFVREGWAEFGYTGFEFLLSIICICFIEGAML